MNTFALTRTFASAMLIGVTVALAALPTAPVALAAPAQPNLPGAKKGPPPPPTAIVVAQEKYNGKLQPIADSVLHAARLAVQLHKAGYRVVLVVDALTKEAKDALDAIKKGPPVVREAATADAVQKEINDWMTAVANDDPLLALLVMSGHGEERDGKPYFLTTGDAPSKGGLSFDGIRDDAAKRGKKGLYCAMIYDACRTPAPPPAPALKPVDRDGKPVAVPGEKDKPEPAPDVSGNYDYIKYRERGLDIPAPLQRPVGVAVDQLYPTVLYSTRSGQKAIAEKGLTCHLADALAEPKELDKFLELMAPKQKGKNELRLFDWLHFAVARLQAQDLAQAHQLVVGSVPLAQQVVVRGGMPARYTNINLLSVALNHDYGEFAVAQDQRRGLIISRPPNIKAPWAGCLIPPSGGLDPTDKVLVLDVIADHPGKPQNDLMVSFNPFHRPPEGQYLNLYRNGQIGDSERLRIPFSNPRRVTVPLSGGGAKPLTFDSIGWASEPEPLSEKAWPPGAALTVVGMELVARQPNAGAKAEHQPLPAAELLTETWRAGGGFAAEGLLKIAPSKLPGAQFQLVPQDGVVGKSRRDGSIYPPRYVPRGSVLVVEAWADRQPAELVVDLLYRDPTTNEKVTAYAERMPVALPLKGQPARQIPLTDYGFANYLRLSTKDAGIHVGSIRIVPKK